MGAQLSRTPKSVFPLTFKGHAFAVHVYNTLRCRVIYNNSDLSPYGDEDLPTAPPCTADYRDRWPRASYLGIVNFPSPVHVTWTSLDGTEHEANIDMGEIFKGERVLYKLPDEEILEGTFNGSPDIFLEVNDRTISVLMQAFLLTKTEQIPGNEYSTYRKDLMLAWSRTY